ncbi:RNA-binding protein S1 [Propionigenium maris DSM 9537]|uniref:RNA-binding protein S1 n=1 Tax=Propionigenium maris DSM 9537 TaxID=1123000 RepID=A0A9W6LNT3_9FUSO|nr:S1-like domain-containing RNA-binding protein [Propionigenium maris]GLI57244.1 RNA-binding protein S1 [Propionigenium maris DSM 9537]
MIKIGKRQKMRINNISSIGAYLDAGTGETADNILLPNNELEEMEVEVGDELNVFIYRDSEDRLIATLKQTKAVIGTMAKLEVVDITPFGAFLDWGLEKDLLLPKGQEDGNIKIGETYLVGIYEDNKGRVSATMNIYKFLLPTFNFEENDKITGTVYRIEPEIGVFVAVEDRYFGLIPKSECFREHKVGETVEGRVMRVREDGKLDLSLRELKIQQMDKDAELILKMMKEGNFNLTDKSSPEEIKKALGMSKKAFKRAMGTLYKNKLVIKTENGFILQK